MKKLLAIISILALSGLAVASASPAPKVTICHATSSETNPWVRIVVSENAIGGHFDNPGTPKAGHEDDLLLQGRQECPAPEDPVDPTDPDEPDGGVGEVPEDKPKVNKQPTPVVDTEFVGGK